MGNINQLPTKRGLLKFILFSIITVGIYAIVVMYKISNEINVVATKHDGKHTMNFLLVLLIFSWLTLGILPLFWMNNLSDRIGRELYRRNIGYSFGSGTFWGWGFFGCIIAVGPFIYWHKLFKAMNMVNESFNQESAIVSSQDSNISKETES